MELTSALLADAASVRENLLSVLNGGLSRLFQVQGGAPLISLSLLIAVWPEEFNKAGSVVVRMRSPSGQASVAFEAEINVTTNGADTEGLPVMVPLLFQLATEPLQAEAGTHVLEVQLAGETRRLPILVGPPVDPGVAKPNVSIGIRDLTDQSAADERIAEGPEVSAR